MQRLVSVLADVVDRAHYDVSEISLIAAATKV